MMRNFYLFFLPIIVFLTACTNDVVELPVEDVSEISFTATMTTRATDTAFEAGDNISVTAYDTDGAIYAQNVSYTYSSDLFSSTSPIKNTDDSKELSFRALYPYVEMPESKEIEFAAYTDQSTGSNYTLSDLMSAYCGATTSTTPQLTFDHLLTKMVISVTSTDVEMVDVVVKINAMVGVSYNISTLASSTTGSIESVTMASNGVNSYKAIIAPQSIAAGTTLCTLAIGGETYIISSTSDVTMIAGKEYTFNVTVKDGIVEIDSSAINNWESEVIDNDSDTVVSPSYDSISDAADVANSGTSYSVKGTVSAVCNAGFIISDSTGSIYVYSYNQTYSVGDILNIEGATSTYSSVTQFTASSSTITEMGSETYTYPTPTVMSGSDLDDYVNAPSVQYVQYTGTLTISGNYINVVVDGASKTLSVNASSADYSALNGSSVVVTGYINGCYSSYIYTVATSIEEYSPNTYLQYKSDLYIDVRSQVDGATATSFLDLSELTVYQACTVESEGLLPSIDVIPYHKLLTYLQLRSPSSMSSTLKNFQCDDTGNSATSWAGYNDFYAKCTYYYGLDSDGDTYPAHKTFLTAFLAAVSADDGTAASYLSTTYFESIGLTFSPSDLTEGTYYGINIYESGTYTEYPGLNYASPEYPYIVVYSADDNKYGLIKINSTVNNGVDYMVGVTFDLWY